MLTSQRKHSMLHEASEREREKQILNKINVIRTRQRLLKER